jgi:NAD-dependent deacetylase
MTNTDLETLIGEVAGLIVDSEKLVFFTGAGVSTESGIPDFRSPGGIWTKYDPEDFTYQKFVSDPLARKKSWMLMQEGSIVNAKPNRAHYAIAELEELGKLDCVITQNVDGLHQAANVSEDKVIELHGTWRWVKCLSCGRRYPSDDIRARVLAGDEEPVCEECKGMLKSATVLFGEAMPLEETAEAERRSRRCDLCIVIGSSLVVYPAAQMPFYALASGAKVVIINEGDTPMDDQAHVRIYEKAGEVMSRVMVQVKDRMGVIN